MGIRLRSGGAGRLQGQCWGNALASLCLLPICGPTQHSQLQLDAYRTRAPLSKSETANITLAFLEPFTVVA